MLTKDEKERLRELALAATPQNFDTAETVDDGEYECPMCSGDGYLEAKTYTNYDNIALGVQFFGIGDAHKAAEDYYRAANPQTILALLDEIEKLQKFIEDRDWILKPKRP